MSEHPPATRTPWLRPGDRVGLVACSDGLTSRDRAEYAALCGVLDDLGLEIAESPHVFAADLPGGGRLRHDHAHPAPDADRARALEDLFLDPSIAAIFDVSGGDLAGGVLTHLDLGVVAAHPKPLAGYSDLTSLLNAVAPLTPAILWTPRALVRSDAAAQRQRFVATFFEGAPDLFACDPQPLAGDLPPAPVVGGNLRCLLKLAGTPHWPDLAGRVLVLESHGGTAAATYAGLHQLRQLGAFDQLVGVALGTFTALQRDCGPDAPARILLDVLAGHPARRDLPIATVNVGHGADSRAVWLGHPLPG